MQNYGYRFIKEIISFNKEKRGKNTKKADTYKATHQLLKDGLSVEEISHKRGLSPTTVYSHLAKLYETGAEIDLHQFVSKADIDAVRAARGKLNGTDKLKPYFEHFEQAMDYGTIRLALTILDNEELQLKK